MGIHGISLKYEAVKRNGLMEGRRGFWKMGNKEKANDRGMDIKQGVKEERNCKLFFLSSMSRA